MNAIFHIHYRMSPFYLKIIDTIELVEIQTSCEMISDIYHYVEYNLETHQSLPVIVEPVKQNKY